MSDSSPQLTSTGAIETDETLRIKNSNWHEYKVKAYPHNTDYAGIVWHGSYLTWMEEARIDYLEASGIKFSDLVELGCDLPVVELSIRYHLPLKMGAEAVVKTRMEEIDGVKINWDYRIESEDGQKTYVTGRVTLVTVDREKGKVMRQLPPAIKDALIKQN